MPNPGSRTVRRPPATNDIAIYCTGPPGADATKPFPNDTTTSDDASQDKKYSWSTNKLVSGGLRVVSLVFRGFE